MTRRDRVPCLSFASLFYFIYRPWQLTWGATADEVARPMVGDELVETPTFNATRAVTWAWGLYESGGEQTRLVTRLRGRAPSVISQFTPDAFEIIMMRKCLLGIKDRAESDTA